jgi:hypothetical protein
MQEFMIHTLIDITETGKRRKEPGFEVEYHQQQNFTMLLQTIGMRVNPHYTSSPTFKTVNIDDIGFGDEYSGEHTVWSFKFFIEFDGGFTDSSGNQNGLLLDDLNLIPIVCQLNETISPKHCVFDTKNKQSCNTVVTTGNDK